MPEPADEARSDAPGGDRSPATPARAGRLKRRADFLHVGKGRRWHGRAMTVQVAPRRDRAPGGGEAGDEAPRFGFTLTKKVGCAVIRNRARRRLREAVRLLPDLPARPGHDYVVVGRVEALRLPFAQLLGELARAVAGAHSARQQGAGASRSRGDRPPTRRS